MGDVENVEVLVAELGLAIGSLQSSYLGLRLGGPARLLGFGY